MSFYSYSQPSNFGLNFSCGTDHTVIPDTGAVYSRGSEAVCLDTNDIAYIGVHYHFILDDNGNGNFREMNDGNGNANYNGFMRAEDVINLSNNYFENVSQMFRLPGNTTPIPFVRVRFFLLSVNFHRNTSFQQSSFLFPSNREEVLAAVGIDVANTINYFEVNTNDGSGIASGITGTSTVPDELYSFVNTYEAYVQYPEWTPYPSSLFNHEIGHLLGLIHTWNRLDGCDDTPQGTNNQQCWAFNNPETPFCNDWANISNNLMDYNQYSPHAITPCQTGRINDRLASTLNKFIYSCETCAPPSAILYARDSLCSSLVKVIPTASMNETKYKYDVCEVSNETSEVCLGSIMSTGWINGQAGEINLSSNSNINFQKDRFYKITLTVANDSCLIDQGSTSRIIKTLNQNPPCIEAPVMPEIQTVYPNPTPGNLNIQYRLHTPGMVRVDLLDSNSGFVANLEPTSSKPIGIFTVNTDISGIQQGVYYVTHFQDNIPVTSSIIRL